MKKKSDQQIVSLIMSVGLAIIAATLFSYLIIKAFT